MGTDFQTALGQLQNALAQTQHTRTLAENALAVLAQYETDTAAKIAKYLRAEGGVELDVDAIKQTVTRPYTLIPQNEQKALLVHWRGVKLPIFGWVKKQEGAFTIAEVSRGMDLLTPFPEWLKSEMGEAYAHPERITKRFVWRIREYELQREASLGHYHIVTLGDEISRIPKHIRFAQPFVVCKGHRANVPGVDKQGFCDSDCKELYLTRQRKQRK